MDKLASGIVIGINYRIYAMEKVGLGGRPWRRLWLDLLSMYPGILLRREFILFTIFTSIQ